MSESIIATGDLKKLDNPQIYFDANIWLFIHCPLGNYNSTQINEYSSAFSTALSKKFTIYTSFTTISEFVNRYLRLAGNLYKENHKLTRYDYKRDFRSTDEYQTALRDVKKAVMKIVKFSEVINFTHSKDSLSSFLDETDIDFNDLEIVALCKENNLYLLTDDGDFLTSPIPVISSNKKYFQ